jgi:hypothetical protein
MVEGDLPDGLRPSRPRAWRPPGHVRPGCRPRVDRRRARRAPGDVAGRGTEQGARAGRGSRSAPSTASATSVASTPRAGFAAHWLRYRTERLAVLEQLFRTRLGPGGSTTLMTAVRLQRTIPAPPAEVYRPCLDPALLRRCPAPAGLEVTRAEVDERVGGRCRIWHAGPGGDVGGSNASCSSSSRASGSCCAGLRRPRPAPPSSPLVHERLDDLREALPDIAAGVGPGHQSTIREATHDD